MKDFKLSADGRSPQIEKGDFVVANSEEQEEMLIMMSNKGDWRESPDLGVGLEAFIDSDDLGGLYSAIQENMEADDKRVKRLDIFQDGTINLETENKK